MAAALAASYVRDPVRSSQSGSFWGAGADGTGERPSVPERMLGGSASRSLDYGSGEYRGIMALCRLLPGGSHVSAGCSLWVGGKAVQPVGGWAGHRGGHCSCSVHCGLVPRSSLLQWADAQVDEACGTGIPCGTGTHRVVHSGPLAVFAAIRAPCALVCVSWIAGCACLAVCTP